LAWPLSFAANAGRRRAAAARSTTVIFGPSALTPTGVAKVTAAARARCIGRGFFERPRVRDADMVRSLLRWTAELDLAVAATCDLVPRRATGAWPLTWARVVRVAEVFFRPDAAASRDACVAVSY